MEQENNGILNPVETFLHQKILDNFTYPLRRQLSCIYEDWGKSITELYRGDAPACSFSVPDSGKERCVSLLDSMVAGLFLYHYFTFYLQPELSEQELAWVKPMFESFLSGKDESNSFSTEQIGYLLWLYEYKRVPVEWAVRLLYAMMKEYNNNNSNSLMKIRDVDEAIRVWGECYKKLIEVNQDKAKEEWAEKKDKWRKREEKKQAKLREMERVIELLEEYERNATAVKTKLSIIENAPEGAGVVRYRKIKGMLDADGILWISGNGKFNPEFLNKLPSGLDEDCKAIYFAEGITDIEVESFTDYEEVAAVHLPDSIRNIKKAAFENCKALTYVRIPRGLRYIGERAFDGCEALTSLKLPETMEYFHKTAFDETGIYFRKVVPESCKIITRMRVMTDDGEEFLLIEE